MAKRENGPTPIATPTPVLLYLNGLLVLGEKPNFNIFWRGPWQTCTRHHPAACYTCRRLLEPWTQ